ncbi:DUF2971 domain-containing protein [uncultured Desulfobacter sp.]|uniref:DUF2971 domain-containing protein n=1 Tax=uncultured Desulfobacter sp. TaxID=240139 RepID=UPI0029C755C2|nr:DUF2971 domain-containing protein [uncultured Desulfobacter sp.]
MNNQILYKYRPYNCRSLSILKNREFYFSDPKHFNDPVDCQIGIYSALKSAVELAQKEDSTVKDKLQKLGRLEDIYAKIENDVKRSAVFSLSKEKNNVLMWSHYTESHTGFSLGFTLSKAFTEYNESNAIIGKNDVHYSEDNPFVDYFIKFAKYTQPPEWNEFWVSLLSMGLVVKSKAWEYENEVRIIRGKPGNVQFSPSELKVVIFGLNLTPKKRMKIRNILSDHEWRHVQMKEVIRKDDGFRLKVVNC